MSTTPPSILLITCDELIRDTLSIYGNRAISTPYIDAIAKGGMRFERAHTVSPWCLPARCALLTGRYPHNSGAYSNFRKCPLDNGLPNLFTQLKEATYHVSMFGKCHFVPVPYGETRPDRTLPYDTFKDYYLSLGLDHLDLEDDKQVSVWFMDDWAKDAATDGTLEAARAAVWNRELAKVYPFPGREEMHPDIWVADKAVDYIRSTPLENPLFAWVSFSGPHYPMDPPQRYIEGVNADLLTPMVRREGELDSVDRIQHRSYFGGGNMDGCHTAPDGGCKNYDEDYWQRLRICYNANVKLIDDMVGKVVAAARERYGENLLIIFTADHGEMLGNHGVWGKHNCAYREVWSLPLFVNFPDGRGAGMVSDALVNTCDILPTCLEAAGKPAIAPTDGVSLYNPSHRAYTFSEGEGFVAVYDGRFKYVHVQKKGEHFRELLDTLEDPCEFENRIADPRYAADLARLREAVIEHFMGKVLP
jgi:arylsulfatase A-like enzyme